MPEATVQEPPAKLELGRIGIIAGEGQFPMMLARAARDRHVTVTAIGIRGITAPDLANDVDAMHWVDFGQFSRVIELCHQHGISHAILAGRIKHRSIFQLTKIDARGIKLLAKAPTRKADALLGLVGEEFARENIKLLDSTLLIRECMPGPGLLTPSAPPSQAILDDIEFGRPIADSIAGLDIGQTVVVKNRSIVAVEAMEGTNRTILRAGSIAGEGCVVLKINKPRQDKRFDVPVLGLTTVKKMIQAGAVTLAFPGGEVLFFELEDACSLAASRGISIYAW